MSPKPYSPPIAWFGYGCHEGLNNAVDQHPILGKMHRDDGFNFEHVLRAVVGTNIKRSVVLKRNTDEIGYWIQRRFPKLV